MMSDPYVFLAIDYFATGEGRSIFLLVTRAYPRREDYEVPPTWDTKTGWSPGVLKSTRTDIALREMRDKGCDPYFMEGVEELKREEFLTKYQSVLPEAVINILNETGKDAPGNFNYYVQLHFNYS
jgi:hypothetical protein